MCVIAICEKRSLNEEEFRQCFTGNHHGMGYAFWDGEKTTTAKGFMDIEPAWEAYGKIPVPHIVHFRLASAGGIKPELTHPFICTKESPIESEWSGDETVLFHNGTISDWKALLMSAMVTNRCVPKGPMSDSRAVAILFDILGEDVFTLWSGSRWVTVDKTGFKNYGEWVEGEDGILYSNSTFKKFTPAWTGYTGYASGYAGYNQQTSFLESPSSVAIRNGGIPGGKSCKNCVHYKLNMECEKKGKLKDLFTCKDYKYLPPFPGAEDHTDPYGKVTYPGGGHVLHTGNGWATCEECIHYLGNDLCSIRGELKDHIRCRKYFVALSDVAEENDDDEIDVDADLPEYLREANRKHSKRMSRKEKRALKKEAAKG